METTVVNTSKDRCDVYIGRGSKFGNPFVRPGRKSLYGVIEVDDPIQAYADWMAGKIEASGWDRPTLEEIRNLKGKTLGCFCKPKPCHGDVLAKMANES